MKLQSSGGLCMQPYSSRNWKTKRFTKNCLDMADGIKKYCGTDENDTKLYGCTGIATQKNSTENELYDETKLKFESQMEAESKELYVKREFHENEELGGIKLEETSSIPQLAMENTLWCRSGYGNMDSVTKCHESEQDSEAQVKHENCVEMESNEFDNHCQMEEIYLKTEDKEPISVSNKMDHSSTYLKEASSEYTAINGNYQHSCSSLQNGPFSQFNGESSNIEQIVDLESQTRIRNEDRQTTKNQDIQALRKLLSDWKQEFLVEHFIAEKVFVNVLKVIKHHHIERLLKNFQIGTQILFEHNLEEWRKSIGLPLVYCGDNTLIRLHSSHNQLRPSSVSPSTSSCPLRASTPPRQPRLTPYEKPKNESDDCGIYLSNILNETAKGTMLVDYYNKFLKFQDEQRTLLINLIAQYFEEKGVQMTLATSYRLEREILERFATEKLEYYRSGKRGRMYNKFCNLKTSFKTAICKYVEKPGKKPSPMKYRLEKNFEPEDDAEACLRALRFDNLAAEHFDNTWKACSQYRLKDIKSLGDTSAIMEKWPFYKSATGFRLIDMDFSVAFENAGGLLNNWNQCTDKLVKFLSNENHVKEKNIKALLEHLITNGDNISENSRNAVLFWVLHGYFVPTNKLVKKENGKYKTTKFTIKDSQESFLFMGKCLQEVEDHILHLKQTRQSIQPFVYCIGPNLFSIEEIYVFFDDIRFKFFNFLKAVDMCFKIMYVFDLDFPKESCMFYSFIETYFFKFKTQQNFPKVYILAEYLGLQE